MSLATIEQLLTEAIGLDPRSIGHSTIERAIRHRMETCGLSDPDEYRRLLVLSPAEKQELIEAVAIPETWFYRDAGVYRFLTTWVTSTWRAAQRARALRILSLPSSTGEEPYTIAMALLSCGLERFQILGIDVRYSALRRARAGTGT